jgi:hypothetical protein
MKQIQPVVFPLNIGTAIYLNLVGQSDNLVDSATFYYALLSDTENRITDGLLSMDGFDYQAYSTSPDSNAYAYDWAASKLNVTLV